MQSYWYIERALYPELNLNYIDKVQVPQYVTGWQLWVRSAFKFCVQDKGKKNLNSRIYILMQIKYFT